MVNWPKLTNFSFETWELLIMVTLGGLRLTSLLLTICVFNTGPDI